MIQEISLNLGKNNELRSISTYFVPFLPSPVPQQPHNQQTCKHLLFSSSAMFNSSMWPQGLQDPRLLCPPLSPGVCLNSCPSSLWCHATISSSVIPFSSCLQSFPKSEAFLGQLFASGGQSTGASASASVLPVNIQDWYHLGLTALISLLSKLPWKHGGYKISSLV